jgi:hypothetical protein
MQDDDCEMQRVTANPVLESMAQNGETDRDSASVRSIVSATPSVEGTDPFSTLGALYNGNISYDKFVRLSAKIKAKIDESIKDWDDDDEIKTFITSSHMVLYKWKDYMSIPRIGYIFRKSLWFGARLKDKEGRFLPEDNNSRFLMLFHDSASLFTLAIAYLVLFGEVSILIVIVEEMRHSSCHIDYSKGDVTLVPLLLCTLYAASVASDRFFRFTPFELTGQTMESYCAIADILVHMGKTYIPAYVNFNAMFGKDLQRIMETDPSRKTEIQKAMLVSHLQDSTTIFLTLALQAANMLLLTTVAIVMGTSTHLLSLIQNFVSVEIVVHIHEFIPNALRLRDMSQQSFNSSFTAVGIVLVSYSFLDLKCLEVCIHFRTFSLSLFACTGTRCAIYVYCCLVHIDGKKIGKCWAFANVHKRR